METAAVGISRIDAQIICVRSEAQVMVNNAARVLQLQASHVTICSSRRFDGPAVARFAAALVGRPAVFICGSDGRQSARGQLASLAEQVHKPDMKMGRLPHQFFPPNSGSCMTTQKES